MLWTLTGTFEERVKTAALAGMQTVELTDEYTDWDDAALRKAKRYIESFGMTTEAVATRLSGNRPLAGRMGSMADSSSEPAFLAELKIAIGAAQTLEAPYVIVMSGTGVAGRSREDQYASLLDASKRAADLAAAANLTLVIEPVSDRGFYLTTCTEGLKLVKEVDNPHLRLLFNAYHEQVQQGNVAAALRDALEYTAVVHLADAPGRHDPGTGSMDFREIYRVLSKGGYSHTVGMEYLPKGELVASLRTAVDSFRAGVNERGGSPVPTEAGFV